MAAVLLVLLIACSNVASLALARGVGMMQEVRVRIALGASRLRLVRQLLMESLCVALAGGFLGAAAALLVVKLLTNFHPANVPRIEETSIDGRVLLFTLIVSLAATVLSGLFPAWSGSRRDLNDALKGSGTRSVKGGVSRVHRGLLVAEMALTIVLLIASGLLIRSFLRLRSVDKGFSAESAISMNIELYDRYNQPQKQNAFFRVLLERAQAVPGIEEAAAIDHVPLGGGESITLLEVEGHPFDEKTSFESRCVTPRYFAAMGIPLLEGRVFDSGDEAGGAPVIIVSRSFEWRYFPGQSAIGKHVHTSGWRTIVGVVADVRQRVLDVSPPMEIYLPLWQTGANSASVVLRTSLPAVRAASLMRGFVRKLDAGLAVGDVRTIDGLVSEATAERRFQTLVFAAFGGIALFLSLVGLYGLVAWSVQQRTAEIGIRMALGAQQSAVMRLILQQEARLWLGGTALGIACAWGVTRWMRSLLFDVQPNDPTTFLAVALLYCLVATWACYMPAQRATLLDPATSLRYE
jgi:predicted permease